MIMLRSVERLRYIALERSSIVPQCVNYTGARGRIIRYCRFSEHNLLTRVLQYIPESILALIGRGLPRRLELIE
jgi:hypothetical protein